MKAMQDHPKLRIKIPRLLVVTRMQRKSHFHFKDKATANDKDNTSIRPTNQLSRTPSLGSVFSSVLGNKRSLGKVMKNEGNGKELGNKLARGGEPVVATLSQLLTLEPDRGGEGNKQNRKEKQRVKMNIPLFSFLNKKKGWNNFIRAKLRTVRFRGHGDGDGVVRQMRRKVSSWRLVRIPSKIVVVRLKLKMLAKKKVTKQVEQGADENGDEDNDRELCQKRILMGGRCKPLCSSGTLTYDTEGLFLPEIVP